MPAPLEIVVTNAGRAAIVNAQNTGTAPVTITQIGLSATAVTPLPTSNALAGEIKRIAAIAGEVVADDTIHVTLTDESADAYTLRSLALYLADGTLFAIYGQAGPVLEKTAQSIAALSIDVIFADIAAAALTFGNANFTNPPATTERQGVVELATVAEAQAGIDALRSLTPAAAKAAILGWLLSQDGSGSGLDADLLDGQDGSYYSNITARLGYTPVNKAGDTVPGQLSMSAAGPVIELAAVHTAEKQIRFSRVGQGAVLYANVNQIGLYDSQHGSVWAWDYGSYFTIQNGKAWTSANDGAGSGLDADLLDGQEGSYYSNITARLGYTPVQQGGGTGQLTNKVYIGWSGSRLKATVDTVDQGNIVFDSNISDVWRAANDGSGSGLDADLLDGQHGSYYSNITARLGYTPANIAGDSFTGPLVVSMAASPIFAVNNAGTSGDSSVEFRRASVRRWNIGDSVASSLFYINRYDAAGGYLSTPISIGLSDGITRINGNLAWHAGNDGAGSGLDADLLDGFHASAFAKYADFTKTSSYEILPDGRILQWGFADALPNRGTSTITFPISFPNAALQMLASLGTALTMTENRVGCGAAPISLSQGQIAIAANASGTTGVTWLAIGH